MPLEDQNLNTNSTSSPIKSMPSLAGKKGLIVGIANEQSIAFGCAQVIRKLGGAIAVTYMNAKGETYVRPLAVRFGSVRFGSVRFGSARLGSARLGSARLGSEIIAPLDVERPGQMEAVFAQIAQRWGRLDFLLHAIAYAPAADLHGRMVDSSAEGFARAMDISCHSFVRMARLAEPMVKDGGALVTMSHYGAQKVIPNYGIMGAVKAAQEATVRYLAAELGQGGIRVRAVSASSRNCSTRPHRGPRSICSSTSTMSAPSPHCCAATLLAP